MIRAVFGIVGEEFGVEHGRVGQNAAAQIGRQEGTREQSPRELGLIDHGRDNIFGRSDGLVEGASVQFGRSGRHGGGCKAATGAEGSGDCKTRASSSECG